MVVTWLFQTLHILAKGSFNFFILNGIKSNLSIWNWEVFNPISHCISRIVKSSWMNTYEMDRTKYPKILCSLQRAFTLGSFLEQFSRQYSKWESDIIKESWESKAWRKLRKLAGSIEYKSRKIFIYTKIRIWDLYFCESITSLISMNKMANSALSMDL